MVSGNVPAAIPPRIAAGAGLAEPSLPRDSAELAPIAGTKAAEVPSGVSYSEAAIEIETQYQDLLSVYQKEQTLKASLDNCTDCSGFADVWHMLGEKFTPLRDFAGGLATVSPSAATVESDFSLMNWEKNKFRRAQTDFSLKGILHNKQYEAILKHVARPVFR
jgi:hypothetical protein